MCLQGLLDQASSIANACFAAVSSGHDKFTYCFVLGLAVGPVALLRGDLADAERAADMLLEGAMRQSFTQFVNVGRSLKAALMMERGDLAVAADELRSAFDTRESTGWRIGYPEYACTLARCLAGLGETKDALAMLEDGLARSEQGGERWYAPELLRIEGEVYLQSDAAGYSAIAEDCFMKAIATSHDQGARLWELRAAASLARLMRGQGRNEEARRALSSVYDRFTEGFETADLRGARLLLAAALNP